ncbi:hypothetical protein [Streptomyces sp. AS02]|uniref:hypothetical protein n=1 Tax=Streptomyces sp. AS02 TaxID=2938946 RepID=UPI002020F2D9|nr:hypothetical protein [Streptomyces sp. AS02]MCL8014967.1 hypothetical protein [Streptomyces sp. AS02]
MPTDVPAPPEPADAPRPRRRGRTALLIAGAVVLGLVAGTCTGYLVQADREPTRLPPLSQPVVDQAKGEVEPLSAAEDRRLKTDGDLRKLLLKRPKGARDAEFELGTDGWLNLAEYARTYEEPGEVIGDLIGDEFRRAAVASWRVGGTHSVAIHLTQYRQEQTLAASANAEGAHYWAEESDTRSWPIPGTGDGMAYVHDTPEREAGYLPLYSAEAHAWRGDIAMDIWVYDTKPIPKKKIMDLAERQMGRL